MNRRILWAAGVIVLATSVCQAQDKSAPESVPAPDPDAAAAPAVSATPFVGPAVPVPSYYPAAPCTARRHRLLLWLTYVPSRRPYFDGHLCQKAPNIQPPLYDFFPCIGESCYSCGTTAAYYPCNGKYCGGKSPAANYASKD